MIQICQEFSCVRVSDLLLEQSETSFGQIGDALKVDRSLRRGVTIRLLILLQIGQCAGCD